MLSIGIIMGLTAMLCWGFADFFQAVLVKRLGTLKTIFIGNLIGMAVNTVFFIVFFALGQSIVLTVKDIVIMAFACFIQALASYNFFKSLEIGEVSIVAPISGTFSLITVILAVMFLGETLSIVKIVSILLIVLGVVFVSTDFSKLKHLHTVKGVKEALLAVLFWGIYFFVLGLISKNYIVDGASYGLKMQVAAAIFLFTNLFGALFMLLIVIFMKTKITKEDMKQKNTLLLFIVNLVLYTGAWVAVNIGIVSEFISILTPVSSLYPAVTILLAVIFFKDRLVINQKIGIFVILSGIFLISMDEAILLSFISGIFH